MRFLPTIIRMAEYRKEARDLCELRKANREAQSTVEYLKSLVSDMTDPQEDLDND